jgi:hypothetical protein
MIFGFTTFHGISVFHGTQFGKCCFTLGDDLKGMKYLNGPKMNELCLGEVQKIEFF